MREVGHQKQPHSCQLIDGDGDAHARRHDSQSYPNHLLRCSRDSDRRPVQSWHNDVQAKDTLRAKHLQHKLKYSRLIQAELSSLGYHIITGLPMASHTATQRKTKGKLEDLLRSPLNAMPAQQLPRPPKMKRGNRNRASNQAKQARQKLPNIIVVAHQVAMPKRYALKCNRQQTEM
ncbi:hypothetical protein EJ03DRAFT_9655 [Teratosphaeria nubilosa]|uniref:Uncharacterized protein n=1 Tax=Teratosphaeria nubilosa TaxID=161662 RepID=A0A6G1LG29_9PEZI|nr:hypothetical protein EJ03DRAFT_9655 [Teratosphaeria nubilosa]